MSMAFVLFLTTVFVTVFIPADALLCYQCNSTQIYDQFQCGEFMDNPQLLPTSCDNVYGAKYCVKQTGHLEGGVGTRRFCSSADMGSYCNYVRQPGDKLKDYRSCFYTCTGDGCNSSDRLIPPVFFIIAYSIYSAIS